MSHITILKEPDSIKDSILLLEDLHKSPQASKQQKQKIKQEIIKLKMGLSAERTAHYHLSKLQLKNDAYLISDLRLEILNADGTLDIAQIDHLLINKYGFIRLFETKSFSTGIKINKNGIFSYWNDYQKKYKEIASPLKQSKRHEPTLLKALENIGYHGITNIQHYVLVDYKSDLNKPEGAAEEAFRNVCRADQLEEIFEQENTEEVDNIEIPNIHKAITTITKGLLTSRGHIEDTLQQLTELHTPITFNYEAKFGVKPASDYLTLSGVETKFQISRATIFKYLIESGLVTKGKYGWFITDQGKAEDLIMKSQGNIKTLYLPKDTIEKAFRD